MEKLTVCIDSARLLCRFRLVLDYIFVSFPMEIKAATFLLLRDGNLSSSVIGEIGRTSEGKKVNKQYVE